MVGSKNTSGFDYCFPLFSSIPSSIQIELKLAKFVFLDREGGNWNFVGWGNTCPLWLPVAVLLVFRYLHMSGWMLSPCAFFTTQPLQINLVLSLLSWFIYNPPGLDIFNAV